MVRFITDMTSDFDDIWLKSFVLHTFRVPRRSQLFSNVQLPGKYLPTYSSMNDWTAFIMLFSHSASRWAQNYDQEQIPTVDMEGWIIVTKDISSFIIANMYKNSNLPVQWNGEGFPPWHRTRFALHFLDHFLEDAVQIVGSVREDHSFD